MGIVIQPPIGSLCLQALGLITREGGAGCRRDKACMFSRQEFLMCLSPRQFLASKTTSGERSSIDLPEHDVERVTHDHGVR
jgi:hypothetical protein